jgi:thioesterase domain-containing protein
VATFVALARCFSERPVYAFQAPGLDGECWPMASIPSLARCYLAEIDQLGFRGPLGIAGVCMGGLVAFEMARQWAAQRKPASLVGLLDTHHPEGTNQNRGLADQMRRTVRDAFRILRWRLWRWAGPGRRPEWLPAYRRFVAHMHSRARRAYRPGHYRGTLSLVLAADEWVEPSTDPRLKMARHADRVQMAALAGRRGDLFRPPTVEALARQLQAWLEAGDYNG